MLCVYVSCCVSCLCGVFTVCVSVRILLWMCYCAYLWLCVFFMCAFLHVQFYGVHMIGVFSCVPGVVCFALCVFTVCCVCDCFCAYVRLSVLLYCLLFTCLACCYCLFVFGVFCDLEFCVCVCAPIVHFVVCA